MLHRKTRINRLGFVIVALAAIACSAFLFIPFDGNDFSIHFNEQLIAGKRQFLSEKIVDPAKQNRPNIILILADDLGQTDISLYGNKIISTPHIDGIGKSGVTFTQGYISSPICSPSRAGLLTGRYQQRFGHEFQPNQRYLKNMLEYYGFKMMPKFRPLSPIKSKEVPTIEERLRQGLPPSEITIAEVLKKYDYATAVIGKWHLGTSEYSKPCALGFDYQYGFYEAFTLYAKKTAPGIVNIPVKSDFMDVHEWKAAEGRTGNCAILRNCGERQEEEKYLTDKLTDEAIQFVDKNAANPFFLYLPYNAPHAPLQATKKYYDQFAHIKDPVKRVYAAMIKNLDDQVGRLLNHIDSLGMTENTIVIFLSDNGGAVYNGTTDNAPYRGGKFTNFEGGIKVPFMMKWPAKIKEETVFNKPVISLDVFTTIASILETDLPNDRTYDGVNLLPYITKKYPLKSPHQELCWRSDFNKAIIKGDWKLIVNEYDNSIQLYDLKTDSVEQKNVFLANPKVVKAMQQDLDKWEGEMVKPLWPRVVNYVYKDAGGKYVFAI